MMSYLGLIFHQNMEFCTNPSSTTSLSSSFVVRVGRYIQIFSMTVSAVLGNIVSAFFSFFFAVWGTLLGAITGAVIGQETGCGLFRGAAIGSVSGALLSIEVFESVRRLWKNNEKGAQWFRYLIDVLGSVLSGRLVRERVGAMMLCPMRSRMDEIEASSDEVLDIFETEARGLSSDLVENIPIIEITTKNNVDSCGEKIPCSVCLQDFQIGDTVRNLPYCHHMFHPHCIDQWLIKRGSCPLCRRDL